jgi:hypothetical protein
MRGSPANGVSIFSAPLPKLASYASARKDSSENTAKDLSKGNFSSYEDKLESHLIRSKINEYTQFLEWLDRNFRTDRADQKKKIKDEVNRAEAIHADIKSGKPGAMKAQDFVKAFPDLGKKDVYGEGMDERDKQVRIAQLIDKLDLMKAKITNTFRTINGPAQAAFGNIKKSILALQIAAKIEWMPIPILSITDVKDKYNLTNPNLEPKEFQIKAKQLNPAGGSALNGSWSIKWTLVWEKVNYGGTSGQCTYANGTVQKRLYYNDVSFFAEPPTVQFKKCKMDVTLSGTGVKDGQTVSVDFGGFTDDCTIKASPEWTLADGQKLCCPIGNYFFP